ncbi:hypothetical protein APA59_33745 [Pseudomonas aeruginosa]|nr:hypothetical protein APA59_33745 [Pseudomonas aeruginosa]
MSVTLAYSPAVRTTRLDYLATQISFRLVKGASLEEVETYFNKDKQDENETRRDPNPLATTRTSPLNTGVAEASSAI